MPFDDGLRMLAKLIASQHKDLRAAQRKAWEEQKNIDTVEEAKEIAYIESILESLPPEDFEQLKREYEDIVATGDGIALPDSKSDECIKNSLDI